MKEVKDVIDILKKWKTILNSKQKKRSIMIFCLFICSSLLETLGVSVVMPFISAMLTPELFTSNEVVLNFMNRLHISCTANSVLICLGIIIVVVYCLKNIFLLMTDYACLKYENTIQQDFSVLMLKSYMKRSYEDYLDINTAEALRGINEDVTGLYYIVQSCFRISASFLTIIMIGIFLIGSDPIMAIELVLIAIVVFLLIGGLLRKQIRTSGERFNRALFEATKSATQALNGRKEIAVLKREDLFIDKYKRAAEEKKSCQLKYRFIQTMPLRLIEISFVVMVIVVSCIKIITNQNMTAFVPQLSVFAVAAIRIMPLVNTITSCNATIIYYLPSFNNAYNNILESRQYLKQYEERRSEGKLNARVEFREIVSLKNICFKYRNSDNYVLDGLNLVVNKGESIGIIGESGAGKTTVADLIMGLLKPLQGMVMMDRHKILDIPIEWSQIIGYIPQTVYLIDDTIRSNILFGIDEKLGNDRLIWESLKKARLKDFVEGLPKGLNTVVGEQGVKLSGGQRQRIAIARAMYNNPEIIVLDEATSALDTETETAVMEAIENMHGEKTLIIIAHRLSTLRQCDRIIRIEKGIAQEVPRDKI